MAYTTLEDFLGDIVGKARRGQDVSEASLTGAANLTSGQIGQVESYALTPEDDQIRALAGVLHLDGDKLVEVARGWVPERPNEPYEDDTTAVNRLILDAGMEVNCYILKCKRSGEGAVIDPGGQPDRILGLIDQMQVRITHILLTHGHGDHVGALQAVADQTGAPVYGCERDFGLMRGLQRLVAESIDEGWRTRVGQLEVETVCLPGHTPGGIGYGTGGVFFSGDALFAGSLGGARGVAYTGQIEAVWTKVLSRDGAVRIFPGHGPLTTVAEERAHNPYFVSE